MVQLTLKSITNTIQNQFREAIEEKGGENSLTKFLTHFFQKNKIPKSPKKEERGN